MGKLGHSCDVCADRGAKMITWCSRLQDLCRFERFSFIPSLPCFSVRDVFMEHSLYKDGIHVLELKSVKNTVFDYQLLL